MPEAAINAPDSVRRNPPLLWGAALVFLVLRVALGFYESRHPPKFKDLVQWVPAAGAQDRADDEDRPILYFFTASWCGPCKVMSREVFTDKDIADQINRNFVPVRLLDDGEPDFATAEEVKALQERYGIAHFPTLLVVSADHPPAMSSGYSGKESVVQFLTDGWTSERQVQPTLAGIKAELERQKLRLLDGGVLDGGNSPATP